MDEYLEVHASAVQDWLDCNRRGMVRSLQPQLRLQGIDLAGGGKNVAAVLGTSVHSLMQELYRQKKVHGVLDVPGAFRVRQEALKEELGSCTWDDTTPHFETAQKQLLAMMNAFVPIAETTNMLDVETELYHDISPLGALAIPIRLIGKRDGKDSRKEIHDHKTGAEPPQPYGQMGCYVLLEELRDEEVSAVRINYAPRLPASKLARTVAKSYRLDIDECRSTAWTALKNIQRQYYDWLESGGDPNSFPTNNKSNVCGEKYCNAFDSKYCKQGCKSI